MSKYVLNIQFQKLAKMVGLQMLQQFTKLDMF
jgi:hypothetical protein